MRNSHSLIVKKTTINNQEVDICRTNLPVRPFEARANGKAMFSGYVTRDGKTIEFYAKHSYQVVDRFDAETFEPILDVDDFPAPGPASAQDIGGEPSLPPSDYKLACEAERDAEEAYWREFNNKHPIYYSRALLALREARLTRAAAALVEVQSRSYNVRRTSYAADSVTVIRAPEALAQIHSEWLPDHDVTPDDAALQDGLPVYTFEAVYKLAV